MVTPSCAPVPLRSSPSQPDFDCFLSPAVADTDSVADLGPGSAPTSLLPLQEVRAALATADKSPLSPAQRLRLREQARAAGPAIVPLLIRGLLVEKPAQLPILSADLLTAVGGQRVIERLSALLGRSEITDAVKERAIEILSDLKVPTPPELVLKDPDALIARGVRDLLAGLQEHGGPGPVLDQLFELVPVEELPHFIQEVETHGGAEALPLLRALIHDPRTPRELAVSLTQRVRPVALPNEGQRRDGLAEQLERALALISSGELERACARLTALRGRYGDDAEVLSALGLCLLRLDDAQAALGPLRRAAEVEPQVAAHHWNVAVAAQTAEQPDVLTAALSAYLSLWDRSPGAEQRKALAHKLRATTCATPASQPTHSMPFPHPMRPPRFPTPRSGPVRKSAVAGLPTPQRRRWRLASSLAAQQARAIPTTGLRNGHC